MKEIKLMKIIMQYIIGFGALRSISTSAHQHISILLFFLLVPFSFLLSCSPQKPEPQKEPEAPKWSVRMADSEMVRFPEAWMIEKAKEPRWGYTHGAVAKAMIDLFDYVGDSTYYYYGKGYIDKLVTNEGVILTYDREKYNLDNINPGKILFRLYKDTGDEKYKIAIETLMDQMRNQPRTEEGGYWHKQIYPNQMWLDGIFMAGPFLAQYAKEFNQPQWFDEAVKQVRIMFAHAYDPTTGLLYHGYDESRKQKWADKETGLSPNFWGRSIGWFAMALVDILDYLPQDHRAWDEMIGYCRKVDEGILAYRDLESALWWQVVDRAGEEGNYPESSASCMFAYFIFKLANKAYVRNEGVIVTDLSIRDIYKYLVRQEEDGTYSIINCCAVAGLGGSPRYRDGSYEYYISEPVIDNDPKSVAAFIWAAIEHEKFLEPRK